MRSVTSDSDSLSDARLTELAQDIQSDDLLLGPLDVRDIVAACKELRAARAYIFRKETPLLLPPVGLSTVAKGLREAAELCDETAPALRARLKQGAEVIDKLVDAVGAAILRKDVMDSDLGYLLTVALDEAGAL